MPASISTSWSCGHVEAEAAVCLHAQLRGQPDEEGEDAVARDRATGDGDALGEARLDPLPLRREGLLPVRLEQRREALDECLRVVEELGRRPAGACSGAPRARDGPGPDLRIAEHALAGGTAAAAVVVDRAHELVGRDVRLQPAQARQLGLEVLVGCGRVGQDAVRQRPPVEKGQIGDLALQRLREAAHRAHPLVLERVVLRLGEHVQALHALEERRVPERERRPVVVCKSEADCDARSLPHRPAAVNGAPPRFAPERII